MKTKFIFCLTIMLFQFCKAQQYQPDLPKLENYTKGELELKIKSFGDKNPITVGKVMADGTIHFKWFEADLSNTNENDYMTQTIERFYGGKFCRNSNAIVTNENAILVENKLIYLFKYGQPVGCIIPSTQKNEEHNKNQLGSTISWIYSDSETSVKAKCSENKSWEDLYNFDQTVAYNIKFKKGWNLISNTLIDIESWDTDKEKGSLPKTRRVESIDKIPTNMKWQLKYWANDALLEIEQQLVKLKPIPKVNYENWLPKKLGKLKRTSYEIGKKTQRMPSLNNINILFEKGAKKIDVTIVECVGSKDAVGVFTLMMDMASRDWKDETKTGYSSAKEMDGKRVIIDYNEVEYKTVLSYNSNNRFVIKAEATNMKPDAVWETLKNLQLETLINQ